MKNELLKEMNESVDRVNKIMIDDELTQHAKHMLIKEEQTKQVNLRNFFEQWNQT